MSTVGSRWLAFAGVLAVGCAHGAALKGEPEEVLAQAIGFTVLAAPQASRYVVQVGANPASLSLLKRLSRAEHLVLAAGTLRGAPGPSSRVSHVALRAGLPTWHTLEGPEGIFKKYAKKYAAVPVSYGVEGAVPVECEVWVTPEVGFDGGWSLRTPSGVECWPPPSGADS